MIRKTLILIALLALSACATTNVGQTDDCTREGGIGGTGICSKAQLNS